ncbi:Borealin N terminal-domain-containing protein [Xylaria intraflava]|nr:Borealin N terminal-domain-containing protein [Xylaria intraflava]
MPPVQPRKRKSESSSSASPQRNPIKKRKLGITLPQKQALIDNLQLEITERARRLRAQYNIQAQQLRSRVEMRVNRIPRTLRRLMMSELPTRSLQQQQSRPSSGSQHATKPLPVPTEDETSPKPIAWKPLPTTSGTSGHNRLRCGPQHDLNPYELTTSRNETSEADKENQGEAMDGTKKRSRVPPTHSHAPMAASQVLSPTSSNTRVLPRDNSASPTKSTIGRPTSPVKVAAAKASSNILSGIVDKSKAARPALAAKQTPASSTATSNAGAATTTASRVRKAAAPPPAATARGKRKGSITSESSESSATATVKKTTTAATKVTKTAPAVKKTGMSSVKSATAKKTPATKAAPTAGRTLRKRA